MKTLKETIAEHPIFHGMNREHLALLAEGAKTGRFNPGETLFREGEPANEFYLIESGQIALETQAEAAADGTATVQTLGPGDVLGWSWLFAPFVWHFRAVAVAPTSVVVLSGAHLLATSENNHDFGYELMKRVAQIVIRRLQATRKQLLALQVESLLNELN
jgi:CRP-like cAMP-binding protein